MELSLNKTASTTCAMFGSTELQRQYIAAAGHQAQATRKETKNALKEKDKAQSLSTKRLALLNDLKERLVALKGDLADESHQRELLERLHTITLQIKQERPVGRQGGSGKWPVHVV